MRTVLRSDFAGALAASIIATPIRSFTLASGFWLSSFTATRPEAPLVILLR